MQTVLVSLQHSCNKSSSLVNRNVLCDNLLQNIFNISSHKVRDCLRITQSSYKIDDCFKKQTTVWRGENWFKHSSIMSAHTGDKCTEMASALSHLRPRDERNEHTSRYHGWQDLKSAPTNSTALHHNHHRTPRGVTVCLTSNIFWQVWYTNWIKNRSTWDARTEFQSFKSPSFQ